MTFAPQFKVPPVCTPSVTGGNANNVYSLAQTSISTTAVSYTVLTALKALSIASLGALTVWGPPPVGTTVSIICYSATG